MADTRLVFKRYEKKYLLSPEKYSALRAAISDLIQPDEYFSSTVCSIYYDSDSYELIRHSLDHPVFKEKLRLRSYNVPEADSKVFVELKKKYKGVVYKRRISMICTDAEKYLAGEIPSPKQNSTSAEIDWFLHVNNVSPKAFIACEREAYVAKDDHELRITFDMNLRWRAHDLSLLAGSGGEPLVDDGYVLMELKIPDAMPMWLTRVLSSLSIYPTSFSKYGTCYTANILSDIFTAME